MYYGVCHGVTGRHDDGESAVYLARVVRRMARVARSVDAVARVCRSCAACRRVTATRFICCPALWRTASRRRCCGAGWIVKVINAIPWGFGRNLGPRGMLMERLIDTVGEIAANTDSRFRWSDKASAACSPAKSRRRFPDRSVRSSRWAHRSGRRHERHRAGGACGCTRWQRVRGRQHETPHGRHFATRAGAVDGDL